MQPLQVHDMTALNITNAVLGLAVAGVWVFVIVAAIKEALHHRARRHPLG